MTGETIGLRGSLLLFAVVVLSNGILTVGVCIHKSVLARETSLCLFAMVTSKGKDYENKLLLSAHP